MEKIKIGGIFAGKERTFSKNGESFVSSYKKEKILGDVFVSSLGIEGDTQSDKRYHGGVQQALCVFCKKEYEFIQSKYKISLDECSFGENILLLDVMDKDICIGDVFKCKDALFEVSLPRVPCSTIDDVLGLEKLSSILKNECKTGFYLRVLQQDYINQDLSFELIDRPYPSYNIEFVNECLKAPKEHQERIYELLSCDVLSDKFKVLLKKQLS